MDSKQRVYTIEARNPLGKYEKAIVEEMTFDQACQRAGDLLSPTIEGMRGKGTAVSVRLSPIFKNNWTYIPQWD